MTGERATSSDGPPAISVVIVSWNVACEVLACLASLNGAARDRSCAVTVVDNASGDSTVEAVRSAFPNVCVVANAQNMGFARACNQGVRQTRGEYVLLLNPDCRVVGDACTQMAAYLTGHPQVGAVGPRVQHPDGTDDLRSPRRLPTLWSDFCERSGLAELFPRSGLFAGRLPGWDPSSIGSVDGLSGAAMMLRRSALEQVGLLDEGFFLYGEDADLCLRLRQAGWEVHFLGTERVVHIGGASSGKARDMAALNALASRQRFFRKHRGRLYALTHRAINACLALTRMAVLALPAIAVPGLRHKVWLQWRLLRCCLLGSTGEASV